MEIVWDMIGRMASDRLWIYTALIGSLFGLAFSTYFKSTRLGLWLYAKFDLIIDYLQNVEVGLGYNNLKMLEEKIFMLLKRLMNWKHEQEIGEMMEVLISWVWIWQAWYYLIGPASISVLSEPKDFNKF